MFKKGGVVRLYEMGFESSTFSSGFTVFVLADIFRLQECVYTHILQNILRITFFAMLDILFPPSPHADASSKFSTLHQKCIVFFISSPSFLALRNEDLGSLIRK